MLEQVRVKEVLVPIEEDEFAYDLKPEKLVSFDEVHNMVKNGNVGNNLIETRPSMYLLGGQIPGSTHLSCSDVVTYWENEAKPVQEVRALLEERGVNLSKPVYITCGWGITVCVLEAAMQPLGVETKIFDGSYTEYSDKIKLL